MRVPAPYHTFGCEIGPVDPLNGEGESLLLSDREVAECRASNAVKRDVLRPE